MTIEVQMYDTHTMLGVMTQFEPPSSYWLDLCFPRLMTFEDEYIDFEKLTKLRKLAPFVAPSDQGKPIYTEGSTVQRFKPAYVKPKDAVTPHRQLKRRPGELLTNSPMTPSQRANALQADILREQREAIERRWEWMAAKAIQDGAVTVSGEGYAERVVSFGRASNHTVTLGSGAWWTTSSDIIKDLETYRTRCRQAKFGGPINRVTMGTDVWDVVRKNSDVLKQLDTQVRGTEANIRTGVREGEYVEFVGRLSNTLELWVYSDYYEAENGDVVPMMDSKSIVMTGPNVQGVRAFGAILDKGANLQAMPIFPKMWDQEDPSMTFIMSQSAPLMVPVNPNNTLKARVLE